MRPGNAGVFLEKAEGEIGGASGDDVADRRAHQTRDAGGGGDEDPFLPQLLPDDRTGLRTETRIGQGGGDRLHSGRVGAIEFAEHQTMEIVEMLDAAVAVERRGNLAQAAKDLFRAEARGQDIEMAHAVEHGQDRGLRTDGGGEGGHGVVEVIGLATQKHEVKRLFQSVRRHHLRRGQMKIAKGGTEDDEAGPGQGLGAAQPHEKCDVAPGLRQPAAEIAAQGAGADHENSHVPLLSSSLRRGAARPAWP